MSNYNTTRPDYRLTAEQVAKFNDACKVIMDYTIEMPNRERQTMKLNALLSPGDVVTMMSSRYLFTIGETYTTHRVTVKQVNKDGTFTSMGGYRFHFYGMDGQYCTPNPNGKHLRGMNDRPTIRVRRRGTELISTIIGVESQPAPAAPATAAAKIATVAVAAIQLALFA